MKLKEGFEIKEEGLEFKLDSEFVNLNNSLLEEELEKLENSIKADGCRDPLVIWEEENILLDGHHRLFFCQKHNKSFKIFKHSFPDRFSALLWAWCNDKGRRGSGDSPYYDCETTIEKFKDELERRAKERQLGGLKQFSVIPQVGKREESIKVEKILANLAQHSHTTIYRTEFIIKYADEKTKEALRKRRPELQFRAIAEKLMMLYPQKLDSEKEKKFKESLDKETIMNTLNLPQAQKFVESVREINGISKEKQKKVAQRLGDISDKETIKSELIEEKHGFEKRLKSEKEEREKSFEYYLSETTQKIESLKRRIVFLFQYRDILLSEHYQKSKEGQDFVYEISDLFSVFHILMTGKKQDAEKTLKMLIEAHKRKGEENNA